MIRGVAARGSSAIKETAGLAGAGVASELDRGGAQVGHAQQRVLAADPAPASATPAGAAERHVDVPPAGAGVDDHLTHREFLDESVGLADVPGEYRRLQAERVAVGDAQ